jgi:prepilin signal peptidase PulO-like enzyme (type II secretory pathway)
MGVRDAVYFSADNLALVVVQAACVALPGAGLPAWAQQLRARWWALVLPLSIAVVVAAIAAAPTVANVLSWVALVLVPPGCVLALGWAGRGARPQLVLLAAALLVLAWVDPGSRLGQVATTLLIAGSAVTLGRLLAGLTPLTLLKAGVVAMAVVDAYLVFTNRLQAPNATLVAASPGRGLPQLQSAHFGAASLGYGDFFAAAVVGAILAAERRNQLVAAVATIAFSLAWDQLFLIYDVLPATIPPAVTLLVFTRWRCPRSAAAPSTPRPARATSGSPRLRTRLAARRLGR